MEQHWRAIIGMFGLILAGFVGGLTFDSITVALWSLMSGLVVAFVMSTAFLRADGHSPEHHPRVDAVFGDTSE